MCSRRASLLGIAGLIVVVITYSLFKPLYEQNAEAWRQAINALPVGGSKVQAPKEEISQETLSVQMPDLGQRAPPIIVAPKELGGAQLPERAGAAKELAGKLMPVRGKKKMSGQVGQKQAYFLSTPRDFRVETGPENVFWMLVWKQHMIRNANTDLNTVMVDVGAGVYPKAGKVFDLSLGAQYAAKTNCKKGARVFAFEPNKDVMVRSQRFHKTERYPCFSWHNNALSSKEGHMAMYGVGAGNLMSLRKTSVTEDMPVAYYVDVLTLDAFLAAHNVQHVDYLKIDAEGNDFFVLEGAAHMLETLSVDLITIEFGSHWNSDYAKVIKSHGNWTAPDLADIAKPNMLSTVSFMANLGYASYLMAVDYATKKKVTLVPLSGTYWDDRYDKCSWRHCLNNILFASPHGVANIDFLNP